VLCCPVHVLHRQPRIATLVTTVGLVPTLADIGSISMRAQCQLTVAAAVLACGRANKPDGLDIITAPHRTCHMQTCKHATRAQRRNLHGDLVAGRVVEKGLVEERVGRHVVPVELFEVLILLAAYAHAVADSIQRTTGHGSA
jgi:hypothetical protein